MIISYREYKPCIDENTFIASNSTIIGRCIIEEDCSVWFNSVIRADVNEIKISKRSNIQDGVVIHCDQENATSIGENVTVGHNAIIHGCSIGNNCIIGMGSTILDGARVGKNSIVGANALVTSGKIFPDNCLIVGSPAKVVRELTEQEIEGIRNSATGYYNLSAEYKNGLKSE